MEKEKSGDFPAKPLTLDLAGLSKEELANGSSFLGGSHVEITTPNDTIDYENVDTVVFRWGDPRAIDAFSQITEHRVVSSEDILPFSASAVIGDQLWHLVAQPKNFTPQNVFASELDYTEVPFTNEEEAMERMAESADTPCIGKIGSQYVLFEMAIELNGPEKLIDNKSLEFHNEEFDEQQVINYLDKIITSRDFDEYNESDNYKFTLNMTKIALKLFGRPTIERTELHLFTEIHSDDDNVKGKELPSAFQGFAMQDTYMNKPIFDNEFLISLRDKDEVIPMPPEHLLPQELRDKLDSITTAREKRKFLKDNPEALQELASSFTKYETLPQVSISLEAPYHRGWGVEFRINEIGIQTLPFGEKEKTLPATQLALSMYEKDHAEVSKDICELILLCFKYKAPHYYLEAISEQEFVEMLESLDG